MARSKGRNSGNRRLLRNSDGQVGMFEKSLEEELEGRTFPKVDGPVECMGMTFATDKDRREYFLEKLREKLQNPEFRKIEGFPIGEDEDILRLSDPPYYTACPNPFLEDLISCFGKPLDPREVYNREPYATDLSEGKSNAIYNAHSYHTKVPHKVIMRYILHYTDPGDIVFDGFCGTGMTGVAAQLCADNESVEELGLKILTDGVVVDRDGDHVSKLGPRHAILSDLSPLATFVASNYCNLSGLKDFTDEALHMVDQTEQSLAWLYQEDIGRVVSAIWSDAFLCPNCNSEFVFWDAAVVDGKMEKEFSCPNCNAIVGKSASKKSGALKLERPFESTFDPVLQELVNLPKFVLVSQTAEAGSNRKSSSLSPEQRQAFLSKFHGRNWPRVPNNKFFPGRQTNKLINGSGISYIAHMYTPRSLYSYSSLWELELSSPKHTALFRFCLSSINNYISRKQGYFGGGGGVSGTLFTPSIHIERNVFDVLRRKLKKIASLQQQPPRSTAVTTQSITDLSNIPASSVDYVFTDPPFGESLQYAELNLFVEAWLRVQSVAEQDCVLNYVHDKDLQFYGRLMAKAFAEYARILKPGRWITVEFHNSQNAVWNAIQQAIEAAGLIVADVRVLDKQQRSFNAVNRAGAVDRDLVISAYRPTGGLEERFKLVAGTNEGVWDFIRTHLTQLPVFVAKDGQVEIISERQGFLLFDRMVAFHIQHGVMVPTSASEFYAGLEQRFPERDGMYFLPEQVAEYDRKRLTAKEVLQLHLFVIDESSAIQWLRQQLIKKPQTFQELFPQFMKEIGGWQKHETPLELLDLLNEGFLRYDGIGEVPSQVHSYISSNFRELRNLTKGDPALRAKGKDRWFVPDPGKAHDLELLRERTLLGEFEDYNQSTQRKLSVFRVEAVRAGFKRAWQEQDYATIIAVAGKIPDNVLQEDPKLIMWYDQALTRSGAV